MRKGRQLTCLALLLSHFYTQLAAGKTPKDTIVLAWEAEPRSTDPRYAIDANSQYLESLVHCSLISFDESGKPFGSLATDWQWLSETSLSVRLKPGIKFSDGSPVTAEDVAATYQYFLNDNALPPTPRRGAFSLLSSVKVADPEHVVFTLKEVDATFPLNLVVGILPKAVAGGTLVTAEKNSPSCGPYKLVGVSHQGVRLNRNDNYSLGSIAKTENIHIKIVKDESTRYAKLLAQEIDILQNLINRDKVAKLVRSNPELTVQKRAGLSTTYLGFNLRDSILAKKEVRQAIGMAIHRERIIKYVLHDMAIPADTLLPRTNSWHAEGLPSSEFNPEVAKSLLEQAGFKPDKKGVRLKLTYKTTTDLTRVTVAKAIAADLRAIGIQVTIETLEWGRFKADVDQGKVQMWSLSWIGFKDPDIYRFAFSSDNVPPKGGNRGWFISPTLDQLLTKARITLDPELRKATYIEVQKQVAMEVPYVFLWHEDMFAVLSKEVSGFQVYADGRLNSLVNVSKN